MAARPGTSILTQQLSSGEDWQKLIAWDDDELIDPLFQGHVNFPRTSGDIEYNNSFATSTVPPKNFVLEQQAHVSPTTPSSFGEPTSLKYVISGSPSIVEAIPSFDQKHSLQSRSPSYTTSATSPLAARDAMPYHGSFEVCDELSSQQHTSVSSPRLDKYNFGSLETPQAPPASGIFNPYLSGTPHSFSGRDVSVSQAFSELGTWAEPSVEPIPELQQESCVADVGATLPIPIIHSGLHSFSNTFSSHPWADHLSHSSEHPRGIAIPKPHRNTSLQPDDYRLRLPFERHSLMESQSNRQVPPILSVSPEQRRSSRTAQLTRSVPNPRRSRSNRLATPSPTSSNLGWVSYQPNIQNRLVPFGTEGNRNRRQRGRVGALTAEQRSHAALMRLVGSCSNCKKRKEKCDPGIPCKSCLDHYKGDLVHHPCRDRLLSDLAEVFLAERHGWHPTARAVDICSNRYQILTDFTYVIPITFGFGSPLYVTVHAVRFEDTKATPTHEHIVYSWPPSASYGVTHTHAVLPAILSTEAQVRIEEILDDHLGVLVDQHFRSFPLYCSQLRILRDIYVYCRSLPTSTSYSHLLRQALKLLVLVHIGGDITLPSHRSDTNLEQLIQKTLSIPENVVPTPCFIRSQFGSVMPKLALKLMREVLLSLEQLFLNRECYQYPVALATLLVVLMTIESIQYHATKLPYHDSQETAMQRSVSKQARHFRGDDDGIHSLLAFYIACYPGCHAKLSPEWRDTPNLVMRTRVLRTEEMILGDKFVENVRGAIKNATISYLEERATAVREGEDMGFFFDRLAARLLVLRTQPQALTSPVESS